MQVVTVGVSHNSSPVSLRERLAVSTDSLPDVLGRLREHVAEAFVLSTCNRVEIYAVCGHETTGADMLRQFLAAHGNVSLRAIRDASYAYGHRSAVQHLLRVAAGLDSVVLGESEILGQVRRALGAARQAAMLGPVLDRLGDAALACGKRTRSTTALGREGHSMASVALRLAERVRGSLDDARIVVIGAGETAGQVLAQLAARASGSLVIVNRTHARAAALAAEHGADARPWDDLAETVRAADVVIGCTSSASPVVDVATLGRARAAGGDRPLLCLDLGVPRDIDAGVALLPGVTLIDADRIEAEAAARREERSHDLARAEAIVARETERYMAWWRGRGVASTVARLHARADAIREAELERALSRLPELTPRARAVVTELATRVIGKLLHEPTVTLKRDAEGANMAMVVERLFALDRVADIASTDPEHHIRGDRPVERDIHQESKAS